MAATVDLEDLIPDLEIALNIPGENLYATVGTTEWVGHLRDGFWNSYIEGLLLGYVESDGIISPVSGSTPMPRDAQQLIIMFTSIEIIRKRLMSMQTVFRAKAGPVEYEVQQSASVLKALLDDLTDRRKYILLRLSDSGIARDIHYIDVYQARQESLNNQYTDWVN